MTVLFRPVSDRYSTANIVMVLLASERLHDSTSYHSGLLMMRWIAFFWKGAKGYFAYFGKKNCIHSMGCASR